MFSRYGGCSNESRGTLETSQQYGNMLGGFAVNVSGPCYRPTDIIKLQFDELTIDCERVIQGLNITLKSPCCSDRHGYSKVCDTGESSFPNRSRGLEIVRRRRKKLSVVE
jgi:hypothetical protein